jgi:3-oxoacyl-[acyl-carrier protein] reductase
MTTPNTGTLEGRVAFITGAARGIGAATAVRLAREGAAVAVVDRVEADTVATVAEIVDTGGRAIGIGCDVAVTQQVEAAVSRTVAELGSLDILVNNAGVIRDNLLFKMTDEDWDTVLAVHLRGAFLCSRAAQQHMVAQKWGRIVNLSSTSALGNRGQANYAAAKAGMLGFTRTLAIELGPYGINVNSIAPGFIVTAMTEATAKRMGITLEQMMDGASQTLPLRRTGTPDDIAGVVAFLTGPDASYITGQNIYVDGGYR